MSENETEQQVYRKRLDDVLADAPEGAPMDSITSRIRRQTSVHDILGFGFSHLVMTFLVFISGACRLLPSKPGSERGVESAPRGIE